MSAAAAKAYRLRGWAPLPFSRGCKGPTYSGWQDFVADDNTVFNGCNIGNLLGAKSAGLIDCDLDCPEACALAADVLPPTNAIFGRASKPRSHWLYQCDPTPATRQFQFDKSMIVELRSTGVQTMFPPSIHPDGESVEWSIDGEPANVPAAQLERAMGDLAGLCLLVRHWPELHGRYNAEGALIGALLRAGRPEEEVERLVAVIQRHAGAPRDHKPGKTVPRLAGMLAAGKRVPGLGRLKELFGAEITNKVAEWMGLRPFGSMYEERGDGLYWMMRKEIKGVVQIIPVKVANFTTAITEVVTRDDGSGIADRRFIVTGSRGRIEVPADEFDAMSWVTAHWGPWASVTPGRAMKDHAAQAIKSLSEEAEERIVYTHTGWRQVEGVWLYLHAGGGIGAAGPVDDITVELDEKLAHLLLPPITDITAAVRAALRLLDLDVVSAAAPWRAPLTEFLPVAFSLWLAGKTGTFKSAVMGVAQACFGAYFADGVNFLTNWSSTANSIEKITFVVKDMLCGIDDFAPRGGRREINEMHAKADQVGRGAGNLGGRGRMRADTSMRVTYWPRGTVMATAEDVPSGASLRARMVVEQFDKNTINAASLTELQRAAGDGLLAQATAGYVRWIAAKADGGDLRAELRELHAKLRKDISGDEHRRSPDQTAGLALGIYMFIQFAVDLGAIGQDDGTALWDNSWSKLCATRTAQVAERREEDPVTMFIESIPEVLASGMAHVAGRDGEVPQDVGDPAPLGWRRRSSTFYEERGGDLTTVESTHMPLGDLIGWVDGGQLWLLPAAAFKAVETLLRGQGKALPITASTLGKRLRNAGQLLEPGEDGRPAKMVKVGGQAIRVFVMRRDCVLEEGEGVPL